MKKMALGLLAYLFILTCANSKNSDNTVIANYRQDGYWQQHVDYKMEIDMDVNTFKYTGTQTLVYTNNSPDVLDRVFYHLYLNAFQPGSEMDVRSRTILDPNSKIMDRISKLKPDEIGYIKVAKLTQDGQELNHKTVGTVLEVDLAQPIQPGSKVTFYMEFEAQVPIQIRRNGRNNEEGVALSMAQWYPKLAEYDFEGWHAHPYIGREFHGVWGDFDVKITIDKNYVIGGTGYLQNPNEIGHGYETAKVVRPKGDKLTWHFVAPNVHDFTWAADPAYIHDIRKMEGGPDLHFFYKNDVKYIDNWKKLQPKTEALMRYFNEHIGEYPYEQYSVIQGGDGGMEYGMCTLITGDREFESLVGVTSHELAHSWFQFLLATNEAKHEWMDEGFTVYISTLAKNAVLNKNPKFPFKTSYEDYKQMVINGIEQAQTTHADRWFFNSSYQDSAYDKGAIFLSQLGYIIGEENLKQTLKSYYDEWKFKHPTPNDFIRVAEKVSGIELDWYLTDWTRTINWIDYGITAVSDVDGMAEITLQRRGLIPMPIDLRVEYKDGDVEDFYIPLRIMRGEKPLGDGVILKDDWAWAYPTYSLILDRPASEIKSVEIDPQQLMADVNPSNNSKTF